MTGPVTDGGRDSGPLQDPEGRAVLGDETPPEGTVSEPSAPHSPSVVPQDDALCSCGHRYGEHLDGGHECQHGGCDYCSAFTHANVTVEVVFDGPPSAKGAVFVEVERDGRSVKAGEWVDRGDGYWALRLRVDHYDIKEGL